MAGQIYYYIEKCPLELDCSAESWKRAHAWGWSQDEARLACKRHLMFSSYHGLSADDAQSHCEGVEFIERRWTEEEEEEHQGRGQKRLKPSAPEGPPPGCAGGPKADLQDQLALRSQMPPAQRGGGATSSSSVDPVITLRLSQLEAASDSLQRAYTSLKAASRLCQGAAESFTNEAQVSANEKMGFRKRGFRKRGFRKITLSNRFAAPGHARGEEYPGRLQDGLAVVSGCPRSEPSDSPSIELGCRALA